MTREETVGTILDLIFCVLLICFMIAGFHAGLARSLLELVGFIFASVGSAVLANRLSGPVFALLFPQARENALNLAAVRAVSAIVFFILLQMLVRVIIRAVDGVFRLPVLHQVNTLLGGAFGLLKGALAVFLFCAVVQLAFPAFAAQLSPSVREAFAGSRIYRFAYANNPVYRLYETEV